MPALTENTHAGQWVLIGLGVVLMILGLVPLWFAWRARENKSDYLVALSCLVVFWIVAAICVGNALTLDLGFSTLSAALALFATCIVAYCVGVLNTEKLGFTRRAIRWAAFLLLAPPVAWITYSLTSGVVPWMG